MTSIKETYQFALRVEEKQSKKFDNKNSGRGHGGRSGGSRFRWRKIEMEKSKSPDGIR